jgi:hypothetical protein
MGDLVKHVQAGSEHWLKQKSVNLNLIKYFKTWKRCTGRTNNTPSVLNVQSQLIFSKLFVNHHYRPGRK